MSIFLATLKKHGYLNDPKFTIFNVGSRKIDPSDDYAQKGWSIFGQNLAIYGFDADQDACDAANTALENKQHEWHEKHFPLVLSNSTGEQRLYVTEHPACSSLYPPNQDFIRRFQDLYEYMALSFTIEVETISLDEFCLLEEITSVDFLQIDVQGGELLVLEGAKHLLKNKILAIQLEVEFSPLYVGQPLFYEVDRYLQLNGFSFFDLTPGYRLRKNSGIISNNRFGQLLWGDAFYFRDLLQEESYRDRQSPERLFKLACVADVMHFSDYALEILEYLTLNYGQDPQYNFANVIVEVFAQSSH